MASNIKAPDQELENELRSETVKRLVDVALYMSPPVNLYYAYLDYLIAGQPFKFVVYVRGAMIGLCFFTFLIRKTKFLLNNLYVYIVFFGWFHSACVAYTGVYFSSLESYYLIAGPTIVSIGAAYIFFNHWKLLGVFNFGTFAITYFLFIFYHGEPDLFSTLNYLSITLSFIVIPGISSYMISAMKDRELKTRAQLKEEIQQRDKIIHEKVREVIIASDVIKRKDATIHSTQQMSDLAARVAHDIRSPLTALRMATFELNLPDDRRKLIQSSVARINDIANSLLSYRKYQIPKTAESSLFAIGPAIDRAVSEKRVEKSDRRNVRISFLDTAAQYGLFVQLPLGELERHISNILNNAIEAVGEAGEINVYIWQSGKEIVLKIDDSGPGIPEDILKKVGTKGFSMTKDGNGLGIYNACEFMKTVGGSLKVNSQLGKGTSVILNIPLATTPDWFLTNLKLTFGSRVVIVDDDSPILDVWQRRLPDLKVTYHSNPKDFLSAQIFREEVCTYLIDFEYRNDEVNGLDMIERLGLAEHSILVTSRFEDPGVLARAQKMGVKILPKNWISVVPILLS